MTVVTCRLQFFMQIHISEKTIKKAAAQEKIVLRTKYYEKRRIFWVFYIFLF